MIAQIVRPSPGLPTIVLGSGLGGQVALRAAALGLPEVDGLILSAPSLEDAPLPVPGFLQSPLIAKGATLVGLDRTYATGQRDWTASTSRKAALTSRAAAPQAWMRANPELRTGGVTWGWIHAYADSVKLARAPATLAAVRLPVLMLDTGDARAKRVCASLPQCTYIPLSPGVVPHLGEGARRQAWLEAIEGFTKARGADYIVAAAPVVTAR